MSHSQTSSRKTAGVVSKSENPLAGVKLTCRNLSVFVEREDGSVVEVSLNPALTAWVSELGEFADLEDALLAAAFPCNS